MWAPEYDDAQTTVSVRRYPPAVDQRDEPQWMLLPRAEVEDLLASRGW